MLFEEQESFFDVNVVNETRNETYRRLAELALKVGVYNGDVLELLMVSDTVGRNGEKNAGNQVTGELKRVVKAARTVGVHVSPTVVFDGVVYGEVSSGWGKAEWVDWLEKNVV